MGSTKITEDAEGKLTHSFRVGQTKINWVFVDTTSTLIKSTDTAPKPCKWATSTRCGPIVPTTSVTP